VLVAFIVNIIAIVLTLLARKKDSKWLKGAFFVIFMFLAIRYGYGNDYMGYLNYFIDVNKNVYGFNDYISKLFYFDSYSDLRDVEKGWLFLCHLFQPLGFFAMVAVISGIYCYAYYKIINEYVPPVYYWFSVAIFVFDYNILLIQASAIRQSLSIIIFIFVFSYLQNRDIVRYGIGIYISTLFHYSSVFLFTVYYLVSVYKITFATSAMILLLYFIIFIYSAYLVPYMSTFIVNYFADYSIYEASMNGNGNGIGLGLGVLYVAFILSMMLFVGSKEHGSNLIFIKLAIFAILINTMSVGYGMIERMGYYFNYALIVAMPIIVYNIENKLLKPGIVISYFLFVIYKWYAFFHSPIWFRSYNEYHTIFSLQKIF
jgi:hypothetical protein